MVPSFCKSLDVSARGEHMFLNTHVLSSTKSPQTVKQYTLELRTNMRTTLLSQSQHVFLFSSATRALIRTRTSASWGHLVGCIALYYAVTVAAVLWIRWFCILYIIIQYNLERTRQARHRSRALSQECKHTRAERHMSLNTRVRVRFKII